MGSPKQLTFLRRLIEIKAGANAGTQTDRL
jgi:hypothetical protein